MEVCSSNCGMIRHLETVWHVAGEGYIENGCAYAFVLYYVGYLCYEWTCLPCEGRAWLEDNLQPGIALFEIFQYAHKAWDVIVGTCHEVTSAKVYPLQAREPGGEFLFYVGKGTLEYV